MTDNDPKALRQIYFDAWQKHLQHQMLSEMEAIIVDILIRHPEYHPIFSESAHFNELQSEAFALDHNPFFHLGLHVAIAEQVGANRPKGVRNIYQTLLKKHQDKTVAEHKMIDCLARNLIDNFHHPDPMNEHRYLAALKRLI